MKRSDFAVFLNKYLTDYLVNTRGSTEKTIDSYRYAFISLLEYYSDVLKIPAEKICLTDLTYENISGFYKWLQEYMHNGISTRNQRQAAINSFIRFVIYERPEYLTEFQRILGIPKKKAPQKEISYLKADGIKLLMDQISTNDVKGLRDYVILMLMYTTGVRVTDHHHQGKRSVTFFTLHSAGIRKRAKKSIHTIKQQGGSHNQEISEGYAL